MHYLVTGGAGFIGSNIVRGLLKKGYQVTVLDDFSSGKPENLTEIRSQIRFVEGSILNTSLLEQIVPQVQKIIHQAAIPSVPVSLKYPCESHQVNTTGTLNLLEAARKYHIQRFVYASSSSIYGDSPVLPKHESMTPNPLSPYAVNKLCGEHYCKIYANLYQLETVSLRYFNVFGIRQNPHSEYAAVIPKFIDCFLKNSPPTIYGDGNQSRDFTYVDNVVEANILASTVPSLAGNIFNVASGGQAITLNQLVQKLQRIFNTSLEPRYQPERLGDVKHSLADTTAIQNQLGFQPKVSFDEGLQKTVNWLKTQQ